jgi:hypothetical protein
MAEAPERPEDRRDAQVRVIEPLAEHLDLHQAVEKPDRSFWSTSDRWSSAMLLWISAASYPRSA